MIFHLRPETEARLAAHAAALGMSVDDYLGALVEGKLSPASPEEPVFSGSHFEREHGIWVYRTGDPMPPSLVDDTLNAIRRERETSILGNIPR